MARSHSDTIDLGKGRIATGTFGKWCVIVQRLEWKADGMNSSLEMAGNARKLIVSTPLTYGKEQPILSEVTEAYPDI